MKEGEARKKVSPRGCDVVVVVVAKIVDML